MEGEGIGAIVEGGALCMAGNQDEGDAREISATSIHKYGRDSWLMIDRHCWRDKQRLDSLFPYYSEASAQ